MKPLRTILRINAASCLLFGLVFVLAGGPVARFLGEAPPLIVILIGYVLLANGVHLLIAAGRTDLRISEVLYFSAGDGIWFIGSAVAVAGNFLVTNPPAQLLAILVACSVLAMGMAQFWLAAEARGSGLGGHASHDRAVDLIPGHFSRLAAITTSWVAMKTWVKLWLFTLNGLFLAALAFWPEPAARLTLAAWVSAAPLLWALLVWQRGLTRALGLAHLVPWLPLLGYYGMRLTGDLVGPRISPTTEPGLYLYVLVMLAAVGICLALDMYDLARWLRGQRYRLGSPAAAAAGASCGRPVRVPARRT